MAFWGVEIKPGKPFCHQFDASRGRLHISQATLGIGTSEYRSLVQCNVGDKSPVLLCSLLPDKTESCPLDLEYEEVDQVIFSVLGPRSVHLTGYYLQTDGGRAHGLDDESESYGEDIADTESDRCSDDEDEYEADFIDDDDEEAFSPPPEEKSKIVSSNGNGNRKRLKKKYQISDSDEDNEQQVIVKGSRGIWDSEGEDEDILPISTLPKNKGASKNAKVKNKSDKEVAKGRKKGGNSDDQATSLKRKMENVAQDVETERSEKLKESSMPSTEIQPDGEEPKKKKKRSRKGNTPGTDEKLPNDKSVDIDTEDVAGDDDQADVKKKKKKKKKNNKTPESGRNTSIDEEKNGSVVVKETIMESGDRKKKKKKGSD